MREIRKICRLHGGQCMKCPLRPTDGAGAVCSQPINMTDNYVERVETYMAAQEEEPLRKFTDADVEALSDAVVNQLKKYFEEE